ncbi:MAG TPA: hypothetical protein VKL21_01660 [Candidatus Methanoperedens sp.]|nr:hypothetical protein [Candidatus Methanoperedens sp.]
MKLSGIIIALLILIAAAVSGCLSGKEPQTENPNSKVPTSTDIISTADSSEKRVNSEAGVTITAVNLGNNAFDIKLDTHSGSLDYEMAGISYIRDSKGNMIKPESWDGGFGGHHFEGTLKFPEFDDSAGFELVIQDVAGVKERVLKW